MFDVSTNIWSKIALPGVCCRAYHTAVFLPKQSSVLILGGVQYESVGATKRLDLRNVVCLKGDPVSLKFSLQVFSITYDRPVFISNHASVLSDCDDKLYVYGGMQQAEPHIPTDVNSVQYEGAATMFVIDISEPDNWKCSSVQAEYAQSDFRTRGHSMVQLSPDCIMITGGVQKSIFMYTTTMMVPDPCDLREKCCISDSDVVSPIPWINCDFCLRWLHQFCVKISKIPKNQSKCPDCTAQSGKGSGKGQRKRKKQ